MLPQRLPGRYRRPGAYLPLRQALQRRHRTQAGEILRRAFSSNQRQMIGRHNALLAVRARVSEEDAGRVLGVQVLEQRARILNHRRTRDLTVPLDRSGSHGGNITVNDTR